MPPKIGTIIKVIFRVGMKANEAWDAAQLLFTVGGWIFEGHAGPRPPTVYDPATKLTYHLTANGTYVPSAVRQD